MQVGNPPQDVRLFPSSSGNAAWVVLPQGCVTGDPSDCADLRGSVFYPNKSSTWSSIGLYQLGLVEESLLGYSGNGEFGNDTVTLGWPGDGLPETKSQVVQGYATKDFYIGSLGLTPHAVNISTLNDRQPSLLAALRTANEIPSVSWAYTAGAYYQSPKVLGSLTLGGFDTTRFVSSNVSVSFGEDQSRDLLIGIQSIVSDISSSPLLSSGMYALIDSLVPDLWLPRNVCHAFEQAFGLVWNDTANIYLVNDALHSKLTQQNPNVTFRVGASSRGGSNVDIVMPYGSFDLTASAPLVDQPTRYFPLQRAQNDSQYTLGRAFLQQTYIIVDYDRSNFSVSQALFPSTSINQNIVAILPPDTNSTVSNPTEPKRTGLGKDGLIGVIVGVVGFVIVAVIVGIFLVGRKRRRPSTAGREELETNERKTEFEVRTPTLELEHKGAKRTICAELEGPHSAHAGKAELTSPDSNAFFHEMPDSVKDIVHEISAVHEARYEMGISSPSRVDLRVQTRK